MRRGNILSAILEAQASHVDPTRVSFLTVRVRRPLVSSNWLGTPRWLPPPTNGRRSRMTRSEGPHLYAKTAEEERSIKARLGLNLCSPENQHIWHEAFPVHFVQFHDRLNLLVAKPSLGEREYQLGFLQVTYGELLFISSLPSGICRLPLRASGLGAIAT